MITRDNLSDVMDAITKKDIDTAISTDQDYVLLELHVFNAGFNVSLTAMPYSEEVETEASDNGQVFCDFDAFVEMFKESESVNPFLIQLL